jgi:hypothetical protein
MIVISRCWVTPIDRGSATAAAHVLETRDHAGLDIPPSSLGSGIPRLRVARLRSSGAMGSATARTSAPTTRKVNPRLQARGTMASTRMA